MRKKSQKQLPLMNSIVDHAHGYQEMSQILDQNPIICELVLQDFLKVMVLKKKICAVMNGFISV